MKNTEISSKLKKASNPRTNRVIARSHRVIFIFLEVTETNLRFKQMPDSGAHDREDLKQ